MSFFLENRLAIFTFLLTLVTASFILRAKKPAGSTMAWLLIVFTAPFLGIPLYIGFGGRKILTKLAKKKSLFRLKFNKKSSAELSGIQRILNASGIPRAKVNISIDLLEDGQKTFERYMALIQSAKKSIYITTFIFGNDPVGEALIAALADKASKGVDVRLIVDSLGAVVLRHPSLLQFKKSGGRIAYFMPVLHIPFQGRTNLRNHRKLLIIDAQYAILGGMNLAQEYMGPHPDERRWTDLALQVEGESVRDLENIFFQDWNFADKKFEREESLEPSLQIPDRGPLAQVVASGPDVPGDPLYDILLSSIHSAQTDILIVTPYFIPDETLAKALELAAKRGVRTRILLPRKSNHFLADIARGSFIRQLELAGAEFEFYTKMIHAKVVLIDHSLGLLGSANFDMRSLLLNYELGILLYDPQTLDRIYQWSEIHLQKTTRGFKPESFWLQIIEGIGRLVGPYI